MKCSFCGTDHPINTMDMRLIDGKKYAACRSCKVIYKGKKPARIYKNKYAGVRIDTSVLEGRFYV